MSDLNICILMWYNENIREKYADLAYKINKIYCDKHGYDLIKSNKEIYNDREASWQKLPLVLNHIKDYDYVMWIDADAYFYIDSPPITNLINNYNNFDIILSKDIGSTTKIDNINCGVFIVKNTKKSIEIIERWAYDNELFKLKLVNWEQGVLRKMYTDNILNLQQHSIVIPFKVLQHFDPNEKLTPKPYINHLAGPYKWKYYKIKDILENYYNNIKIL